MRITKKQIIQIVSIIVIITVVLLAGFFLGRFSKTRIVYLDLDDSVINTSSETKYKFMPAEFSDYIVQLSTSLEVDPDLVVAILMQENPKFNPGAENRNSNGTSDLGLFQLNSRYVFSTFEQKYWLEDGPELNPFNWKHNTFVAIHLIKDLTTKLKVQDDAIMAYNCGYPAVINHQIPATTYIYLAAVKNNITLLKDGAADAE